jgi:eukaryotic-like serine/threonine-protein kinase
MKAPDETRLVGVAGSILNGAAVDWDDVKKQTSDAAAGRVVGELQTLERIAAFHRDAAAEPPTDEPTAPADVGPLGTWGHLTILERIDKGSFGSVFRARDPKLQADVALKLAALQDGLAIDPAGALREARLLARVRHPNVVRVHGVDVIEGRVGIWMEFVEGESLAALLRRHGPLSAREAAVIGVDLCHALAAVHRAGLIHGDVKARNVMREAGGRTVLMDFGTGKDIGAQPASPLSGVDLAGTPLYLAPEVFRGEHRSKLGDIYGLGVLLYHLVTNQYPVEGRTRAEVEAAHARGAGSRPRGVGPDLPAAFVDAVERAIAVDRRDRFQSAGAFEAALSPILGRTAPAPRPWRLVAALIAATTVIAAIVLVGRREPRSAPEPAATAPAQASVPAPSSPTYQIDTALYTTRDGAATRLRFGDRVTPGDKLFAQLRVSAPTYIYIVNEDDRGESFLLFPLPGQAADNPISPGGPTRVPGMRSGDVSWEITSAGGREHFLIFASPERLDAFEELFAALPRPSFDRPSVSARLSDQTVSKLRGVGGLAAEPAAQTSARLANIFTSPLGDREETARGLWVRQLTVENPVRR